MEKATKPALCEQAEDYAWLNESINMILLVQELLTEHNGGQHMDLDPQNINKVAHNVLKYAIAPQLVASAGRTLPQSPA